MANDEPVQGGNAEPDNEQPSAHPARNAALGAAGEAAAFFAGAPIAGAADAAIGLGDVVTDREAKLEEALTGRHEPEAAEPDAPTQARSPLLWVVLAVLVIAGLVWLFRSQAG